jgi:hypothetical protein
VRVALPTERTPKAFAPRPYEEFYTRPHYPKHKTVRFADDNDVQTYEEYLWSRRHRPTTAAAAAAPPRSRTRPTTAGSRRRTAKPLVRVATPHSVRRRGMEERED